MALVKLVRGGTRRAARALRRFGSDSRASVAVDFIISLPILLAVLVLTSEYGRVLQMRNAMDNAVADAARYLSRVELEPDGRAFPPGAVAIARQVIGSRLATDVYAISDPVVVEVNGFPMVGISAAAGVRSPALGLLGFAGPSSRQLESGLNLRNVEGLVVTASERVRYFGR